MQKYSKTIFLLALILETCCVSYMLPLSSFSPVIPVIYLVSGIFLAWSSLYLVPQNSDQRIHRSGKDVFMRATVTFIFLTLAVLFTAKWISTMPLNVEDADMLPVIKVMNERFVHGDISRVYAPIESIRGGTQPIYLPAMWAPFSLAVIAGIDLRCITSAGLFFGFLVFTWSLKSVKTNFLNLVPVFCAVLLFWWLFTNDLHGLVSMTEEGVVIFYYTLLFLALTREKTVPLAAVMALCLMSRYAVVGFIPAILLWYRLKKNTRQGLIFCFVAIACFLLFFLLPFGWQPVKQAFMLPQNYLDFAARVWLDSPDTFQETVGMARYFGEDNRLLLHRLLILLSFLVPVIYLAFWYRKRNSIQEKNLLLSTVKITLVIFYCFIDVPYLYLFYTSSVWSLLMAARLIYSAQKPGT